jgi:phage-related protein
MEKQIIIDQKALKELLKFSKKVQEELDALFKALEKSGKLEFPDSRKIDKNLFEIRVKYKGQYRGFYAYLQKDNIIALHFFQKKSQKTPVKNLKTAIRRSKLYE